MKVTNSGQDRVELSNLSRAKQAQKAKVEKDSAQSQEVAKSTIARGGASVNLSSKAKALAEATSIARSDISDDAKIDKIKAMIANGNYKPDYGKVADKVINEHLMQELG